jgi:hypothetical protein
MKLKQRLVQSIVAAFFLAGCVNHDFIAVAPADNFIVGRFYGFCNTDCNDIFMLTDQSLYQAKHEEYPLLTAPWELSEFSSMDNSKRDIAIELRSAFPEFLLSTDQTVIGCPDCTDAGGIYLEINNNGARRYWYIDNLTQQPELKNYVLTIHKKLNLILGR